MRMFFPTIIIFTIDDSRLLRMKLKMTLFKPGLQYLLHYQGFLWKSQTASLSSKIPPIDWLIFNPSWMIHPLRSLSITETSSLLWGDPSLRSASVLSFSWVLHLNFSLYIRATGSHVLHVSLDQGHAAFMPDAAWTVCRFLPNLSQVNDFAWFRRHPYAFDTSSAVHLRSSP